MVVILLRRSSMAKPTNADVKEHDELAPSSDVAVVEKTPSVSKSEPFEDTDLVTVLHGFGRVSPLKQEYVDRVLFIGGVARNVPYSIAKWWVKGARPDGKEPYGHVKVQVLPNDATEADFIKVTGIQPMPAERLAALLAAANLDDIYQALGDAGALRIANGLRNRIANQ
jgi:hypothetical protein